MPKYNYNYDEDDYEDFEPIDRSEPRRSMREDASPRPKMSLASSQQSQLNETTIKYMIRDIVHEILHEYVTRDDLYKTIDRALNERLGKAKYVEEEYEEETDDDTAEEPLTESTMKLVEDRKKKFNMDSDSSINSLFGGTAQEQALSKQPQTFDEAITAIGGSSEDWVAEAGLTGN